MAPRVVKTAWTWESDYPFAYRMGSIALWVVLWFGLGPALRRFQPRLEAWLVAPAGLDLTPEWARGLQFLAIGFVFIASIGVTGWLFAKLYRARHPEVKFPD